MAIAIIAGTGFVTALLTAFASVADDRTKQPRSIPLAAQNGQGVGHEFRPSAGAKAYTMLQS